MKYILVFNTADGKKSQWCGNKIEARKLKAAMKIAGYKSIKAFEAKPIKL